MVTTVGVRGKLGDWLFHSSVSFKSLADAGLFRFWAVSSSGMSVPLIRER